MVVLSELAVDIVSAEDKTRFRDLIQAQHYLGAFPGMGEAVRYPELFVDCLALEFRLTGRVWA